MVDALWTLVQIYVFSNEQFLISKYWSVLHASINTHNHTFKDSNYNHLYKNSIHLVIYTHTNIHRDFSFALN